jgi:beta-lactamase superfamily II metal-dependent hydrolase
MQNIDSVKVRMYRHGFGDCFLVRFYKGDKVSFKMLIDCGLKHNDSVEGVSIADVVNNIKKEVGIKKGSKTIPHLDALVVTHEHWDHVSAFKPEKKLFDDFDIDRIWMAWTENPKDKVAQQINSNLMNNATALGIAAKKIATSTQAKKKTGFFKTEFMGEQILGIREKFDVALNNVVEFYGPFSATTTTKSGIKIKDNYKISTETQKAFNHIKTKLAKNKSSIQYYNPGTIIEKLDNLPGVRMYVLGPPKDARLNDDAPSKGAEKEVYFNLDNASMTGFVKGVLKSAGVEQGFDDGSPFANVKSTTEAQAKQNVSYKNTYYNNNEAWRTIEEDWLDMASSLALQMDNDTNNTSLVLAIELMDSGKILLFPGDAQVGNWKSWHDYTWKVKDGTKTKEVTATDILGNTVFYKAGHHASHNATLKDLGLELMTNEEELVVFVPEKEDQYNGIPHPELVDRLLEKAKGRVLFSADTNFSAEAALKTKPTGITKKDWDKFKNAIEITKQFIEYTIE